MWAIAVGIASVAAAVALLILLFRWGVDRAKDSAKKELLEDAVQAKKKADDIMSEPNPTDAEFLQKHHPKR